MILTNKPNSSKKNSINEASDQYKHVETNFKLHFDKLLPKIVCYMNYKNFNQKHFINDLQKTNFELESSNPDENYRFITETFIEGDFFEEIKRHS